MVQFTICRNMDGSRDDPTGRNQRQITDNNHLLVNSRLWHQWIHLLNRLTDVVNKLQFSSVAQSCPTLCDPLITAHKASLSITDSRSLLKLMPIELVMPSSHLILCRPLLLLPPIPLSIRVFSKGSTLCMRWPKYWSFSFNIQSFQWTPRTDLRVTKQTYGLPKGKVGES